MCPSRQLAFDYEVRFALDWFMAVADVGAMGGFVGIREWPRPGGVMMQHAKTVATAQFLLREFNRMNRARRDAEREARAEARQDKD